MITTFFIPENWPDSLPATVLKAAREAVAKADTSSLPTMLRATAPWSPHRLNSEMTNEDRGDDADITEFQKCKKQSECDSVKLRGSCLHLFFFTASIKRFIKLNT